MGFWVPPENRDTRYYLFEVLFLCRVPNIQTMSPEYIRHFGVPTSGDPVRDRAAANELVDRMLTINQMVEYYKQGVEVRVRREADTKRIYDYVTNHLLAWKNVIENSMNPGNPPIDDLILLDQFAATVYPYAQRHFVKEETGSMFIRSFGKLGRTSGAQLLKPKPVTITVQNEQGEETQVEDKPQRESMASIFSGRRRIKPGNWK